MNPNLEADTQALLDQLQAMAQSPATAAANRATAEQWHAAIASTQAFLKDKSHPVTFVGAVGVGKSALIGVVANLLVGPPPTDRASLKESSVFAIGSGRTTVCEVRVRTSRPGEPAIGLEIEPLSVEEMTKEIELYAEHEWTRRQAERRRNSDDDSDRASQEVHRVIREMTGYAERQEVFMVGNLKRRRNVYPIDDVARSCATPSDLAKLLVEKANLPARTQTSWTDAETTPDAWKRLKGIFEDVNQGRAPTAMLPSRMTLSVPDALPGSSAGLDLMLIDTRGLDDGMDARSDLRALIRDDRGVIVLCASFNDAPGDTVRAVLRSVASDVSLRTAVPRILITLVDQDNASQVNGAAGDRELGQDLKVEECHVALEGRGLANAIKKDQIVAFDALKDDRSRLVERIDAQLKELRRARENTLRQQIADARTFLDSAGDELLTALRESVDHAIRDAMATHLPVNTPMTDPLNGPYAAIDGCRYASVVYAACRRNGHYRNLNLYAAVGAEASRAATAWLENLVTAVRARLDELVVDPAMKQVADHVRLRRMQIDEAQLNVVQSYAKSVSEEVETLLGKDPIWASCCNEWGHGSGFKAKVIGHLQAWSRRQQGLTAHERTTAAEEVPFLRDAMPPQEAPQFRLHVRNLRALRHTAWSPTPVSLLIGANGAGKTTLLLVLKVLRLAYERGLPEAVAAVLFGVNTLKTIGVQESEPVELGIDLGEVSWRIQLNTREGSVDYLTQESLTDRGREIFTRDSLGAFVYGEERLEPTAQTGLRTLVNRGARDAAILKMASFLQGISVYHDPDLWSLRTQGSQATDDRQLHARGTNALTLLRRWNDERANRHRYEFVLEGLRAAFPSTVADLDFKTAGNTLVARIFGPGREQPTPFENEANGVLQLLVLLCNVAHADDGGVVAIDEPENGLHPYALRSFLRRTSRWATQHHLTVLLATHSVVLLDELDATPERVFVMKAAEGGETVPTPLDSLCNREWLEGFKLGDLYEQGEIGSNGDGG